MNVLVADDDGFTRLLLKSALNRLGHEVQEADNGQRALESWKAHRQPLIISDWVMPDLSGLDFCREVSSLTGSDFNYLILLTARAGKENYLEAMEAGVDDFISKPFDMAQLTARVRVAERILRLHENVRSANAELELRVEQRTAELRNASEAKGDLLSRASQQMRMPANQLLGFAQLLANGDLGAAERADAEKIIACGHDLLAMIDQLETPSSQLDDLLAFSPRLSNPNPELTLARR